MKRVAAVIIVKNETFHLPDCLQSLQGIVDSVCIVDTGSTDDSVAIAQAHGGRVLHFPWQNDFAAARNFALDHAEGEWVLVIDADERVQQPEQARERLTKFIDAVSREETSPSVPLRRGIEGDVSPPSKSTAILGTVEILNTLDGEQEVLDHTPRFFRRHAFRYEGRIHEQPVSLNGNAIIRPTGLRLLHLGYGLEAEQAAAKAARNIALLQAELAARPDDEYLHYQLGKTFFSVKDYPSAAASLERALGCIDWAAPQVPRGRQGAVSRKVLTDLITTLAYTYVNIERVDDARALLQHHKALAHPGTQRADFFHALGYVELISGNLPLAREAYAQSLRLGAQAEDVLGSGSYASCYHLGLIAEAEGHLEEAWSQYAASLCLKPDYRITLARCIDLIAECRLVLPACIIDATDADALRKIYLERLQRFLENARIQEAGYLAKTAAQWNPQLFQECREKLHQFAARSQ